MTGYIVKIRFWLRASDSVIVTAATDVEAIHMAKSAATLLMTSARQPEDIDLDDRRDGTISYVDRLDAGRVEIGGTSTFAGNRPLHPDFHSFITKIAAMDAATDPDTAMMAMRQLIAEGRSLAPDYLGCSEVNSADQPEWSADATYTIAAMPRVSSSVLSTRSAPRTSSIRVMTCAIIAPLASLGAIAAPVPPSSHWRSCATPCAAMSAPSNSTRTSRIL